MIQFGDLILPNGLQWKNEYEWSGIAQESSRTLGGGTVVWTTALVGGRPIDLEAEGDGCWLSLVQVKAIHAMATQPGAIFTLVLGDATFQVMFRHQDAPATAFTPIRQHAKLFNGVIKLIQVV
ncbi:MAG: hypothetical protein H7839_00900 [Magnetococcus sp. YQC-5]